MGWIWWFGPTRAACSAPTQPWSTSVPGAATFVGVGDPDGRSAAHKPVATVRYVGEPEESIDMTATRDRRLQLLGGSAPVVGLLVLSPIAAEYLSGYQVFNPLVLLGYLAFASGFWPSGRR